LLLLLSLRQPSKKSAFDRTSRESLDDLLVEYQVDDQCRKDRQADRGEGWSPLDLTVLSAKVQQSHLNGAQVVATDEGQCKQQVIPEEKELHQSNSHEPVRDHRQRHTGEDLVDACTVQDRRLDHRARDGLEEPCHQKHRKGQAEGRVGDNQRPAGVDQSCPKVDGEQRQQYHLQRDHDPPEEEELFRESGIPREKIIGVGMGMGGLIDAEHGCCIDSWIMNWQNVEISRPLEDRLGIPVFLDNDVNCLAIYEKLFGQGQPYQHFLVVAIGGGVGLGIVINGDLYRGACGGAGEFGHTAVTTDGRQCVCGNHGCLEAYISDAGIVKNYLEYVHATAYTLAKSIQEPTAFELVERAKNGEEAAIAAFQRAGLLLGVSLANLVNVFNPECIVLSGPDTDASMLAGDLLLEPMRQAFKQHLFSQIGKDLHFLVERLGFESWARGAGSLVLRHFFASPAHLTPNGR
jgi:predicted NBD/HSP70 family sugar kinase